MITIQFAWWQIVLMIIVIAYLAITVWMFRKSGWRSALMWPVIFLSGGTVQ